MRNICRIAFCACLFVARPVLAWNAQGHMLVAQIAYNHLDPAVKTQCDALIAVPVSNSSSINNSFVTAGPWADDIKSFTSAYNNWHYIDLVFSLDGTPTNGVAAEAFDVVQAIRQCEDTLQDPTAAQTNQATALRFLIHFVADIQQPLHCSTAVWASKTGGDAGGNGFTITGAWSNLHSLWDAGGGFSSNFFSRPLSVDSQTALSNKVAAIEADHPYVRNVGIIPDPMDWAIEGEMIAETNSYVGITLGGTPSSNYLSTAQATAEQRLAIGGQRLANLLNTLLATNASVVVTNLGDGLTDEGTLREAINLVSSGGTITFDVPLPATIHLQQGTILLDNDITISGPGADKLVISGDGTNRLFQNDGVTVTISGVTLSNGVDRADGTGGAIANFGTLTVSECTLKNNLAPGPDGHGIGGGGGGAGGGAIFNFETLSVVNSTFSDNQTIGGGGDRSGGGGGGAFGGAIFNLDGSVTASNCTFSGNLAVGGTAGVANIGGVFGDGGSGIFIDSGGLGNHDSATGLDGNDAVDIGGGGGAAADGEQGTGVCDGGDGGNGGSGAFGGGGGLGGNGADGCAVTTAGDGGNGGNGGNGGDGEFGAGGAGAGIGGQPTGIGTLTGSAGTPGLGGFGAGTGVSTNGGGGAGFGGAIFTRGGFIQIVNCTIASNSVAGGDSANHVADGTGIGGGIYNFGGDFEVLNTIIAGNVAESAEDAGFADVPAGPGIDLTSNGHNLIGIGNGTSSFTNGVNGDLVGSTNAPLDAMVGPLANNGGPTLTRALLAGSPAIDAGSDGNCSPTDQRGSPRPSGLHCDIGAFELDNSPVAICHDVTVSLASGCTTNVSIDNGSFDPDAGDTVTLSQSPAGPYPVGVTIVTLTATDGIGATNSCTGTVTIVDDIPPTITCPTNRTAVATSPSGAVVTFADPNASDNCSATVSCTPPSGSTFPIGDSAVVCVATDVAGNTNSCTFSVHVKDAKEQLIDAGLVILGQGTDPKIKKNVLKKFQKIERQIDANRTRNACKQLRALLRQVERDLFKGNITTDQAFQITSPLIQTLTVLGCP